VGIMTEEKLTEEQREWVLARILEHETSTIEQMVEARRCCPDLVVFDSRPPKAVRDRLLKEKYEHYKKMELTKEQKGERAKRPLRWSDLTEEEQSNLRVKGGRPLR